MWCVVRGCVVSRVWCVVSNRFHSAASSALSSRNFEKSAMPWQLSAWHSATNVHAMRGIARRRAKRAERRAGAQGVDRRAAASRRPVPPMDDALAAVSEVASTLSSCYGPLPKEKLLVSATRRVLITSSGATILSSLVSAHPLARLVIDCASAHVQHVGDGGCAFVLLLHALLLEVSRVLTPLPPPRRWQQQAVMARTLRALESDVLPRMLVPRWRAQAAAHRR